MTETNAADARASVRTLREILENPEALELPQAVVPRVVFEDRVSLFYGREKSGKSTFASAAAASVSSGTRFLGRSVPQGDVLYVSLEEHSAEVARRLVSFDADPDRVHVMETVPGGLGTLKNAVAVLGPRLVVVDSLVRLAAGLELDSGDASGWDRPMEDLQWLARTFETGILLIHHARKSDGEYRDSTAIGAGVDALVKFSETDTAGERRFEMRGRWPMRDFRAVLVGREGSQRYELVDGELSLEAQVLQHISRNPGASTREVRRGVTGDTGKVGSILHDLRRRDKIKNRGPENAHQWHLVERDGFRETLEKTKENRSQTAEKTAHSENGAGGGFGDPSPLKGRGSKPPAPETESQTTAAGTEDDLPF